MNCVVCQIGMHHLEKDLYICSKCGLISSDIKPDTTLYDKSYCRKYERYKETVTGKRINLYRSNIVKKYTKDGSVLDFGCGAGEFHKLFSNGKGFDINPFCDFTDVSVLFNKYQAVTFWDSIEHIANPKNIVLGLRPKYLFISTPNYDDFVEGDPSNITAWHHYYPGEHVHYFNKESLDAFLKVCGYKTIYLDYGESEFRTSGGDKNIITIGGELWGV